MAATQSPGQANQSPERLPSLRALVFRFTLAPSLVLAVTLGVLFTLQQIHERRQLLLAHGRASAEQLAELIDLSGEHPTHLRLEWLDKSLMALMLEKDMVRSVHIYSADSADLDPETGLKLLASQGPRPKVDITAEDVKHREPFIFERGDSLQVLHPFKGEEITCWISIELHRPYFIVGTYQVALVTLLGLILCTLGALIWATFLSERFGRVFERLGDRLESIGRGHFESRDEEMNNRELHRLSSRINSMAENLRVYQEEYKSNVLQSMEDLRQSLDAMEEQNIELDLARKKAVEGSRVKSTFLANTSHEIRTPLNGIIGFTNLLLKTELDELQQDYLQTILRSSENLLTTINDIMDFSRIESGNLVLDHTPMDLGLVLEETLQILAPFAYDQRLELVPLIDNQLPRTLIGDPLRIKQIFTSLVSNAVRHSSDGNIPVRLSVQSGKDSELVVRLSVTDLGNRAVPQARRELHQLLEASPHEQGQQISSTGLGLAIARSLIVQMGGSIGVDEAVGSGATYWVCLPLQLERNRTNPIRERFPGSRILLADPNRMTRMQVAQLLQHWEVEPVEIGESDTLEPAIEQMWRHDALPDAVIIDTGIAGGDFEPFIRCVQCLADTYQCRIIVQGSPVELRRCYEPLRTRALAFLAKPVTRDNLLRALRRAAPQQNSVKPTGLYPALPGPEAPRVLAVDDHEANRLLIGELLRGQGVETTVAASGEEALELCGQQPFDLILMDIQMPGMDGIETTRQIRAGEADRRTPIIALTAHVGTEEKARLLAAGLDDYLSKPVSEAQLSHTIQRWMKIIAPQRPERNALDIPRLVDIGESLELSNNDAALARDMLQMLIRGLVADEQEMHRLFAAGDHRGLFELVHRVHGGCCYCGVPRLRESTGRLQELLRPLQDDEETTIDERAVDAVIREIRALREWASEQDLDVLFGLVELEGAGE
ncbi:hybrid sensor histidine kinase/response regulator [Microbulbifer flavimaris]|uniref:histidine kinase n=1 Tax=Microbulbifer flavimaris TaxID=1781068 RepID=A0ABX4I2X5_9GAMM|nr:MULTISPECIES: response regulator [Microbulbifer]KUJ84372.1 hybrid sensor histidine kinase/response regulator [Microbulbifer sp. ZGT114]PCO06456.1 hybrid sensor histidine kinase/response regulator [Microbulbifer flavimaris]